MGTSTVLTGGDGVKLEGASEDHGTGLRLESVRDLISREG